jgi:hypothetical protein
LNICTGGGGGGGGGDQFHKSCDGGNDVSVCGMRLVAVVMAVVVVVVVVVGVVPCGAG